MNPLLIEVPTSFDTERLHIRMPQPGDGAQVYQAIQASKDDLKEWLPFATKNQTEEDVEVNIRESQIKFLKREDLRLLVFDRESGEFVGSSGLHRMDWSVPKFEIGYWIDARKSGKGYMTEAIEGITNFAFETLGARRVEIRCDRLNTKSRAIPERLDFELEGIVKNDDVSMDGEQLRDTCIYAKVK